MATARIKELVALTLKKESRLGETTVNDVVVEVFSKIQRKDYKNFFGAAELIMAAKELIRAEVHRQLKRGLSEDKYRVAMTNAPPDIVMHMKRLPAWIAIEEGPRALWVPSLQASSQQWQMNADLKYHKAAQTEAQAQNSANMALFLKRYGFRSLSELIREKK